MGSMMHTPKKARRDLHVSPIYDVGGGGRKDDLRTERTWVLKHGFFSNPRPPSTLVSKVFGVGLEGSNTF